MASLLLIDVQKWKGPFNANWFTENISFSFYYSQWDCSEFLSVNILSINVLSLQNLASRICDKAAALIWFFFADILSTETLLLWLCYNLNFLYNGKPHSHGSQC